MKIKDLPRSDRPREKLQKYGTGKLSTAELLAILLRTGVKGKNAVEVAAKILKQFPGDRLAAASVSELQKQVAGLGTAKACELVAMVELGRRILEKKPSALLFSPGDVWREMKDLRGNKKEHFVIFFLDSRNQEIRREVISIGTLDSNLVHPREVFEPAIRCNAAQIIVSHNHPSGNSEPSAEDLSLTRRLIEAGKIVGIEMVDHVVVSTNNFTSLKELWII